MKYRVVLNADDNMSRQVDKLKQVLSDLLLYPSDSDKKKRAAEKVSEAINILLRG